MPAQRCARPAARLRQIGKNFPSVHSMETEETPIYVQGEKEKCQYYVCSSSAVPAAAVRARAHAPRGAAAIRAIPVTAATAGTVRRSVRRAAATAPAAARGSAAVRGSAAIPPTITGSMRSAPAAATTDKKDGASRLFSCAVFPFFPRPAAAALAFSPKIRYNRYQAHVAQLADAPDLESGGRPCRFKSCRAHQEQNSPNFFSGKERSGCFAVSGL